MSLLIRLICLLGLLAWPLAADAQEYPSKAIKFVVPFPAGGPADTFARVLGDKLATLLGQPVVIENRAGAQHVPVRRASRRCVIHLPAVVCTNSPSTAPAYDSLCFFCACSCALRRSLKASLSLRGP